MLILLSKDQPESQLDPSPRPSSSIPIPDSNPEGSGGNHGGQAAEIKDLKAQMKQLKKKAKPGRKVVKSSKGAPSVQTHTDWDGLDTDLEATLNEAIDYTLAQNEGKTDSKKTKGSAEKGGSIKSNDLQQSTVKPNEGTDKQDKGTDSFVEGTAEIKDQVLGESDTPTAPTITSTPTLTDFGDDETITQVLVIMSQNKVKQKEKEKGVELKNVEDIKRPRPTSTRSEVEEEKKRLTEEEAIKASFTNEYGFIQAILNADKILAEKLQEEEKEKFTIEERAKLLHDTIVAQRRFLAQ
ncbi:hypothetical protein Tco_1341554 [Tanacetum coccineum]